MEVWQKRDDEELQRSVRLQGINPNVIAGVSEAYQRSASKEKVVGKTCDNGH